MWVNPMNRFVILHLAVFLSLCSFAYAADEPKDTWVYSQSTGELKLNGKVKATGYSGSKKGGGLNNPEKQDESFVGPIPRGEWTIGEAYKHERLGPNTMKVEPVDPKLTKRSEFRIHGDNSKKDQSASEGCIVLGPEERKMIIDSKITKLIVVK